MTGTECAGNTKELLCINKFCDSFCNKIRHSGTVCCPSPSASPQAGSKGNVLHVSSATGSRPVTCLTAGQEPELNS